MKRAAWAMGLFLCAPAAMAGGLLEKNQPTVEAGTQAWKEGRFDDALAAFEAARRELPGDPRVDFDIGTALYKLGRYQDAKDAWARAAENDKCKGALEQKDYYNIGNALAQLNQKKEAVAAYRKALRMDPADGMARHNLEMLLRDVPPQKDPPDQGDGGQDGGSDGGQPDGGSDGGQKGDGGTDRGSDGGTGDGGVQDGGAQDGGSDRGASDGGAQDGGTSDGGRSQSEESGGRDGGSDAGMDAGALAGSEGEARDGGSMQQLSEQDAEKLLDSMKRNEKNLQLWRFQQQKQRKANEKDW